jgi:hypothetical protein
LLVLNLELRDRDRDGHTRGRFFLNGDGCGNYYFVHLEPSAQAVLLWAHDPPGIEDQAKGLDSYLRDAEQDCRIDRPLRAERLCICRTSVHAESILDPIALDDWVAAVNATPGVEYRGYLPQCARQQQDATSV